MDFLTLALAMSGCFDHPEETETEITKLLDSIEIKIVEQAKILCEKETLSPDEMSMLSLCYSTISTIKEKEAMKAQKESKEKELKEKMADLMSGYGIKS